MFWRSSIPMTLIAAMACMFAWTGLATQAAPRLPSGFQSMDFAGDNQLANPVCLAIDEKGRVYIGETFRQGKGVDDNRGRGFWLLDDLASQTTADRLKMYQKWVKKFPMTHYTKYEDRITRLEDSDGDGKADKRTIFADGFRDPLDGTGAGLIVRNGTVYYTCIPKLWMLGDQNDDGKADSKKVIQDGFGVRIALRGHDMHGLVWGPDGKLYWSIGDRGYSFTTKEGRKYHSPGSGGVFRCNPDGSDLEEFAHGLRNPQELAFDQFGNLFTGDNNSDAGDRARIVYICEGGETGWHMAYQTDWVKNYRRGPWHMDKIWHTQHANQPAWILPPIAHLGSGPSGLVFSPGAGMPDRYKNKFFLCDFRGGPKNSGVRAFGVKPNGAGYSLDDAHEFVWSTLATDVDFGYDGKMYIADWINGWNGTGKGKVTTVWDPNGIKDPAVLEAKKVFADGIEKQTPEVLAKLLLHADMRARLRAQYALADKGSASIAAFTAAAKQTGHRLGRLHGIWGLGMVARKDPKALDALPALLGDSDAEVISQAAKVLGEAGHTASGPALLKLLSHNNARVKYFAAMSLGRIKHTAAIGPLTEILVANQDKDVFLRHGCVMGLTWMDDLNAVLAHAKHSNRSVRLAVVLVLRRNKDPRIAQFLQDTDEHVATEAARAINDLPIVSAMPDLAAALNHKTNLESFQRRSINANFRVGDSASAMRLASFAEDKSRPEKMRHEALLAMGDWAAPSPRDRVLGYHRPLKKRSIEPVKLALTATLDGLLKSGGSVQKEATGLANKFKVSADPTFFVKLAKDRSKPANNRIEAIRLLATKNHPELAAVLKSAASDKDPLLRAEATRVMANTDPAAALTAIKKALSGASVPEKQAAFATLAEMKNEDADALLGQWMDKLKTAPATVQLDILNAAKARGTDSLKSKVAKYQASLSKSDKLAPYRITLHGGNAERGKQVFAAHAAAQCMRCHKTEKGAHATGGEAGPNLAGVVRRGGTRQYLLESMVDPNAKIAKGFQMISVTTKDGKTIVGTLVKQSGGKLVIAPPAGASVTVAMSELTSRKSVAGSAMWPMGALLKPNELRDLVEFLATLK